MPQSLKVVWLSVQPSVVVQNYPRLNMRTTCLSQQIGAQKIVICCRSIYVGKSDQKQT